MFNITLGDFWNFLNDYNGLEKEERFDKIIDILKKMSNINIPGAKETLDNLMSFKDDIFDEENPFEDLEESLFTKKEAAELFGVSEKHIQRLVSKGLLRPINPRRKPLKFPYEDLEKCFLSDDFDTSIKDEVKKSYKLSMTGEFSRTEEQSSTYFEFLAKNLESLSTKKGV